MANSITRSGHKDTESASQDSTGSDEAPMIVTWLSGWIDFGDGSTPAFAWIGPTRTRGN